MNTTTRNRVSATIAMLTMLIGVVCGLTLANAAGCDWRAATWIAGGCGAVGLVLGGAVLR
jgi:threonine/homoserine/homoserine lactone efflux protein